MSAWLKEMPTLPDGWQWCCVPTTHDREVGIHHAVFVVVKDRVITGTALCGHRRSSSSPWALELFSEEYCEIGARRLDRLISQGRLFKPEPVVETQRELFEV